MRRYAGTDLGERYQSVLAFGGEGDYAAPDPHERTVGDYLDPTRPGSVTSLVNAVSRDVGVDAVGWRYGRVIDAVAQLVAEGRQREAHM